eukprot:m.102160 g.102160  ORF g.102160 m.102160 type:complete len:363 (-) comp27390_c0_seq1:74-1162(-)
MSATAPTMCVVCGTPGNKSCGGCKKVFYCSSECQKQHWKGSHKKLCQTSPIANGEVGSGSNNRLSPTVRGQTGDWQEHPIDSLHKMIISQMRYFRSLPYIKDERALEALIREGIETTLKGDFTWSLCFDPSFYVKLNYHGFLPICSEIGGNTLYALMPKLHMKRCVLKFDELHISKKVKKGLSKYTLTCNTEIEKVFAGLKAQHGDNWIYPPVREALRILHDENGTQAHGFVGRAVCFELWEDSKLVAGEVGMAIGRNYTSYSGFYTKNGAGNVQICAMVCLLEKLGFLFVDFGQYLAYKLTFGGKVTPREEFLKLFKSGRDEATPAIDSKQQWSCSELIKWKSGQLKSKSDTEDQSNTMTE